MRLASARVTAAAFLAAITVATSAPPAGAAQLDAGSGEVRIVARLVAGARVEFGLQQRDHDGSWGRRHLPRARFFPPTAEVGRWLAATPVTLPIVSASGMPLAVDTQIVARRLANGKIEFGLRTFDPEAGWGQRQLPQRRLFPTDAAAGRWLSSSPLEVTDTAGGASIAPPAAALNELSSTGPLTFTVAGETAAVGVTGIYADGRREPLDPAAVTWRSADTAVATVAGGVITAAAGGHTTITATYQRRSAEIPVSVHISTRANRTVRLMYAVPSDREFRDDYSAGITHAIVDLQAWFRRQLDGPTFAIFDVVPERCRMDRPEAHFGGDNWRKVLAAVQHCAPVRDGAHTHIWVLYVDIGDACGLPGAAQLGAATRGLTILARHDLDGVSGQDHITGCDTPRPGDAPLGRWIGGLGHELGHAFGLPHPPGCDQGLPTCDGAALLFYGYWEYPDTYLRDQEKAHLQASPYFAG